MKVRLERPAPLTQGMVTRCPQSQFVAFMQEVIITEPRSAMWLAASYCSHAVAYAVFGCRDNVDDCQ